MPKGYSRTLHPEKYNQFKAKKRKVKKAPKSLASPEEWARLEGHAKDVAETGAIVRLRNLKENLLGLGDLMKAEAKYFNTPSLVKYADLIQGLLK